MYSSEGLDCGDDFGRLISPGQLVQLGAVLVQILLNLTAHITSALPFAVARTLVVPIAADPLYRLARGQYVGNHSSAEGECVSNIG